MTVPTMTSANPSAWARTWATARPFARPMPRRGAWYPVVGEASEDRAVLEIRGRRVAIARRYLEIRPQRPPSFTAVVRGVDEPNPARGTPADLGPVYAVCPRCAGRSRITPRAPVLSCSACRYRGEVAWWESG